MDEVERESLGGGLVSSEQPRDSKVHIESSPHYSNDPVPLDFGSERGGIISARGTGDGLTIRLDGRIAADTLKLALVDFVNSRKSFLAGNSVAIEWVGVKPEESFVSEISSILTTDFGISVKASRLRESRRATLVSAGSKETQAEQSNFGQAPRSLPGGVRGLADTVEVKTHGNQPAEGRRTMSLFDGIESFPFNEADLGVDPVTGDRGAEDRLGFSADATLWDDPDARIVYTTLRSGQKIETEHSLVICGDVNSGAEVVAGGDVIVLGVLRGIAHAGAYDETGGGRFIFSLNLAPTQLRIGAVISRGLAESGPKGEGHKSEANSKGPEIARVDGNAIVVEPYQSRYIMQRSIARKKI